MRRWSSDRNDGAISSYTACRTRSCENDSSLESSCSTHGLVNGASKVGRGSSEERSCIAERERASEYCADLRKLQRSLRKRRQSPARSDLQAPRQFAAVVCQVDVAEAIEQRYGKKRIASGLVQELPNVGAWTRTQVVARDRFDRLIVQRREPNDVLMWRVWRECFHQGVDVRAAVPRRK